MRFRPAPLIAALVLLPLSGALAETPREQLIEIIKQEFPAIIASQNDPAKREDEAFQKHVEAVEDKCNELMKELRKTDPRPKGALMAELMAEALPEHREQVGKARERAAQVASMNHLKQIAMAFHSHLLDHNKGPATLVELLPYLGDNDKVLLSPAVKDHGERETDYVYFGAGITREALEEVAGAKKVLACDRFDNHGGKMIHAVFLDGHVERIELNDGEPLFGGEHAYLNQQLTKVALQGADG